VVTRTHRWRVLALSGLAVVGCQTQTERSGDGRPDFPDRIEASDTKCENCMGTRDTCVLHVRYGCEDGSCGDEIPCDPSCCERFPIEGGYAIVRPGAQLRRYEQEIGRVPEGELGLLVAVSDLSPPRLESLGFLPEACAGEALDDLENIELWMGAAVEDLRPVSDACEKAVVGELSRREQNGVEEGDPPAEVRRYIRQWTSLSYPEPDELSSRPGHRAEFGSRMQAGRVVRHIPLPADEELLADGDVLCYRIPGHLRPKVCSPDKSIVQRPPL
jgi:hypothetical protein